MADPVMSNFPLRKVLECVSGDYKTVYEISELYSRKHPVTIELWIIASNFLKGKAFDEKEQERKKQVRSVEKELAELNNSGYIEMRLSNFDIRDFDFVELPEETKFYRLSNLGIRAIHSVMSKKK